LDILTIRRGNRPNAKAAPLDPGSKLQFDLAVPVNTPGGVPAEVTLLVDIVAEPVTPALESAFALLRGGGKLTDPVECVRFAWGPLPERIELVSPDDLMHEIVRRRAVFHWSDTIRIGTQPTYAIQKIAPFGSTHFPTLHSLPGS
jgi:hypothetical protein